VWNLEPEKSNSQSFPQFATLALVIDFQLIDDERDSLESVS
jgi:hypothetical protein